MANDFGDLGARFAAQRKSKAAAADNASDRPYDHIESYRLRAKMLGVLIQDARLSSARTVEDCARLLKVEPGVVAAWEFGDDVPSLPQLELLAYYLDVPISHFWGQDVLENEKGRKTDSQTEYMHLRNRMIGALLRQAREERQVSLADVAEAAHLPVETLEHYEAGLLAIPMHELAVLSTIVQKNMQYFMEGESFIGLLLSIREEWKQFVALDSDIRQFASNPLNLGFLKIAMMFGKLPADELRQIAAGMLEISM
jgi:transcriptional regulator with XRE-family HTH domain